MHACQLLCTGFTRSDLENTPFFSSLTCHLLQLFSPWLWAFLHHALLTCHDFCSVIISCCSCPVCSSGPHLTTCATPLLTSSIILLYVFSSPLPSHLLISSCMVRLFSGYLFHGSVLQYTQYCFAHSCLFLGL